jgi:hypothetical protein
MSFNPVTNLMYIPTSANSSSTYRLPEHVHVSAADAQTWVSNSVVVAAAVEAAALVQVVWRWWSWRWSRSECGGSRWDPGAWCSGRRRVCRANRSASRIEYRAGIAERRTCR